MSTDYVRCFSSLFTATMHSPEPQPQPQPWTSKIDVDAMVEEMAAKRKGPEVSRNHVLLIKKLLASINFTPDHPVYPVMVEETISSLNGGKGCSKDEISDFISTKHTVSPVVHLARLPLELDKCVRDEVIVVTSGNLYIARAVNADGGNAGSSGGELKRFRRRQKLRGDGCSGSKLRKEKRIDDPIGSTELVVVGEKGTEGGNLVMGEEDIPPGFEGCIKPNNGISEQCVDGSGDKRVVDKVGENVGLVNLEGQSAEEEVSPSERALVVVHDPLESEDQIQPTPLCSLPTEDNIEEDATLKKLHKKTCEIKRPEEEGKMMLEEKHDQVVNKIDDLSAKVAKLREENLQFDEAGNKKRWFEEEQYKEILEQTEALQQTLKEVIAKAREVNAPNNVASEAESSKAMMQHRLSKKTKRVKWSPELDITLPVESRLDKIQVQEEARRPILKINIRPPQQKHVLPMEEPCQSSKRQKLICGVENQMQSGCLRRELVCGLRIQDEEDRSINRRLSHPDQVHSRVAKGLNRTTERMKLEMSWKSKGPRRRRPCIKRPNAEEFTTLAGKCTQMDLQLQIQDSSQPDEAMHRDMPSEHGSQLQNKGKAHEDLGSQIQQPIGGSDERILPEVTTVRSWDHSEHLPNEQQQVEDQVASEWRCSVLCEEEVQNLLDRSDHPEEKQQQSPDALAGNTGAGVLLDEHRK